MLFNSVQFFFFLIIVFSLYWIIQSKGVKARNIFLIVVGYVFYGCWDWRFLGLLFLSTMVDFSIGLLLERSKNTSHRKKILLLSLLFNLGLLGFFKYFNFFADNFIYLASKFDWHPDFVTLNVILPVGISFYTFQSLSYTIDVYRGKLKATHSLIDFMAFVSFFPQLVAGPIERASHMLPQFSEKVSFDYDKAKEGCRLILWGFFKKIVIADTLANSVNLIFGNYHDLPGSDLMLGAIYFAIQIYCDFSGYSDIATGVARLLGFELMLNFNFPYFSRDISEFWRRWHISLSTWFRDYVYFSLGGSKVNKLKKIRNVFVVFLLSGIWHGANWTFVIWGLCHCLFYFPLLLANKNREHIGPVASEKMFPGFKELFQISTTFLLVTIAWIFFRSPTVNDSFSFISGIFSSSIFSKPHYFHYINILLIIGFALLEWFCREKRHPFAMSRISRPIRWSAYSLIVCLILFNFEFHKPAEFIYFQF